MPGEYDIDDEKLEATFEGGRTIHTRGDGQEERWQVVKILGQGGSGTVLLQRSEDEACRALKTVRIAGHDRRVHSSWRRELEALAKFSRPKFAAHFVKFLGWYLSPDATDLNIAMEYCEHGDLGTYLKQGETQRRGQQKSLPEDEVQRITLQVLSGLRMMHDAGFANRDIKPENILILSKPPDRWWVKICDLGLSRRTEGPNHSTTLYGTAQFMPPEYHGCFKDLGLTPDHSMVDMWNLGETVFLMLTGHHTFDGAHDLMRYAEGKIPFPSNALLQANASADCILFISLLMAPIPVFRWSATQALGHPWMKSAAEAGARAAKRRMTRGGEDVHAKQPRLGDLADEHITISSAKWTTESQAMMRSGLDQTFQFTSAQASPAILSQGLSIGANPAEHWQPKNLSAVTGRAPGGQRGSDSTSSRLMQPSKQNVISPGTPDLLNRFFYYNPEPRQPLDPLRRFYEENSGPWNPSGRLLPADAAPEGDPGHNTINDSGYRTNDAVPEDSGYGDSGYGQGRLDAGYDSDSSVFTPRSDSGYGTVQPRSEAHSTVVAHGPADAPRMADSGYSTKIAAQDSADALWNHTLRFDPLYQQGSRIPPALKIPTSVPGFGTPPGPFARTEPEERHDPPLVCPECSHPCKTRSELKKHQARHNRPHKCDVPGCDRTQGFMTANDLERHKQSRHPSSLSSMQKYRCNIGVCAQKNKLWPRADNFRQHLKRIHQISTYADIELEPFVVKQTSVGLSSAGPPQPTRPDGA